jgi:hypothetical protein
VYAARKLPGSHKDTVRGKMAVRFSLVLVQTQTQKQKNKNKTNKTIHTMQALTYDGMKALQYG